MEATEATGDTEIMDGVVDGVVVVGEDIINIVDKT